MNSLLHRKLCTFLLEYPTLTANAKEEHHIDKIPVQYQTGSDGISQLTGHLKTPNPLQSNRFGVFKCHIS